ncbi:MAG TPA: radical SAM family heme chaperone HemW [Thermoanaerobaculia bacterium]|nr:radical SAM family heme chaperone HemW [Thermoanaerobaculia bacterium]
MTGVYIHLPFCATHCAYCPFVISTNMTLEDAYVEALLKEIDARLHEPIDTLYFGGGTPSRTKIEHLAEIAQRCHPSTVFAARDDTWSGEFTLEANPEDITRESIAAWRDIGVNRLSIGVQSFNDDELREIGRIHDAARAREAVKLAVDSGMRTNLDLILGLPHQSIESFRKSLDEAIALGIGHLSLYMLDLDEKTPLQVQVARGRTTLPEEEQVAQLYLEAVARLSEAGLQQYEISNFARPGEESQHNLRYWRRESYLGFGIGAHSFIDERRFANTRDIHRYIGDPAHAEDFSETLSDDERRHELLFLQLRQTRGIHYDDLVRLCGQEAVEWMERGLREGWLRRVDSRIGFTPAGFLLSNDYISQLF